MSKQQKSLPPQKLGLALGGGGIRGLAHIGVLKVLEREGFQFHSLAGTSMGGIIAAAHGAGLPATELEAEVLRLGRFDRLIKLADWRFSRQGLIRGEQLRTYFADLVGATLTFSDLKLPVAVISVDLDLGREVVLKEGPIVDAMRATLSVPGAFVPVEKSGARLVDGGILNNVPTNVARELGADFILAVDVMPCLPPQLPKERNLFQSLNLTAYPPLAQNLGQMFFIMIAAQTEKNLQQWPADLLIRPQLPPDITLFRGLDRAEEIIAFGEAAITAQLPKLKQALGLIAA